MEKDSSRSLVGQRVSACKNAVRLDGDNQMQPDSGHESADLGNGPNKKAAGPQGSPGTGNNSGSTGSY